MPAVRQPPMLAKARGSAIKNPQRFKDRADPKSPKLGKPSAWLSPEQAVTWEAFKKEIPWLGESDRTLVEIASVVRSRLIAGEEVGVQALNLLRQAISQMGGTPADRSKIMHAEQNEEDPADKYFN